MTLRRTATALVVILPALVPLAAGAGERIRIATEGAYAPWNATDPSGALVGFEVDLARELCRRMEAECEIVAQDWDGLLPGLLQRRYDAVMAGMAITAARLERVDFAGPYASEPTAFATMRGASLQALRLPADRLDLDAAGAETAPALLALRAALAGRTVGVQVSTAQAALLERHVPGVTVRGYGKLDEAALDLAAGRVDALAGTRSAIGALDRGDGAGGLALLGPDIVGGVLGRGVGVAVRKGDAGLRARLDRAIAGAAAAGVTARLAMTWFGFDASVRPAGAGPDAAATRGE
ncbi:octopine/nopaline transport system substrate-binding protein [Azospirillum agricola]|uniref:transporter substrate-binding domain-containing protein n=1 Tax=Azospirillum agricola TaxID=1720247 RepID=UPI001AE5BE66|nr:transporter substrate-binding domain-containing protein [Azospirillum agricola]MBP2233135.1 octopine/nopaline transport system substrate-binding protein [Azospirillum agricola]